MEALRRPGHGSSEGQQPCPPETSEPAAVDPEAGEQAGAAAGLRACAEGEADEAREADRPRGVLAERCAAARELEQSELPGDAHERAAGALHPLVVAGVRAEDGLLQVREIRDLRLRAELVTLSACDTGTGRLLGQEGIASLERAFLLAGAKSVIASVWPADDTYTIALMKRFYQHLVSGSDKGAALRQAKLDLLQEFVDQAIPIYWAGFILVGEGSGTIVK